MTFPHAGQPTPSSVPLLELVASPVVPGPRPSLRRSARFARRPPEDAAFGIILVALGLPRALKLGIRSPVMEDAQRREVRHLVAATQPRRHEMVNREAIGSAADHAGVSIPPAHRGADPLPLPGVELGAGGAVTPTHTPGVRSIRMAGRHRLPVLIQRKAVQRVMRSSPETSATISSSLRTAPSVLSMQ